MLTPSLPVTFGRIVALLAAGVTLLGPGRLQAQEGGTCRFLEGTSNLNAITLAGGERITYMSTPRISCDDGVRIDADSAIVYSSQNMSYLIGNVRYWDRARELRSDQARYFSSVGRLQANGNLFVRDTAQGSVIENGFLIYLRQTSFREEDEMTVTTGPDQVRPTALLHMAPGVDTASAPEAVPDTLAAPPEREAVPDTLAAPPEPSTPTPYLVEADRLFLVGDRYFNASGNVVIERDSLVGHSQIAEYDQGEALLKLQGSARVEGSGFDLSAENIDIDVPGGEMRSLRAVREAVLVGEDLRLTSPVIHMFTNAAGEMDRLVAVPRAQEDPDAEVGRAVALDSLDLARPVAEAEDFRLTADSIEVNAPAQVLDRIFAAGTARGESSARDSLNVEALPDVARRDWLEGDTVIALFRKVEPVAGEPADTASDEYRIERLIAHGRARSLYRLLSSDSAARPGVDDPAVHYVTGSKIEIVMNGGDVDSMKVDGPTRGWHLEPRQRRASGDTVTPPDTGAATAAPARENGRDPDPAGSPGRAGGSGGEAAVALPSRAAPERGPRRRRGR